MIWRQVILRLIGIFQWLVELGWVGILLEVVLISQYQANLRIGHLESLYYVSSFINKKLDMGKLSYEYKVPEIDK